MISHNIRQRIQALTEMKQTHGKNEEEERERIDRCITEGMMNAAKKVEKPRPEWSVELKQSILKNILYKTYMQQYRQIRI